jgi:hypothetical protein
MVEEDAGLGKNDYVRCIGKPKEIWSIRVLGRVEEQGQLSQRDCVSLVFMIRNPNTDILVLPSQHNYIAN